MTRSNAEGLLESPVPPNYLGADPHGPDNQFKQDNLGFGLPVGAVKILVNPQQDKLETGARGNAWALATTYALSKRTNVYASYASMNNNNLANFALNSSSNTLSPAAISNDPSVFAIGLRHTF